MRSKGAKGVSQRAVFGKSLGSVARHLLHTHVILMRFRLLGHSCKVQGMN